MIEFINTQRDVYGVEPICRVLPIAPSPYREQVAGRRDLSRLLTRAKRDSILEAEVIRVFADNFAVYGVRGVWRQLRREGSMSRDARSNG